MSQSARSDEAALIADLNDLLQLDHDAVEAYTIAIDVVRNDRYREDLVGHRADHKRHIEELAALIRARGGLPTELPHPTAPLKLVVQALGAAPNDQTLLLAFKAVEGQGRDKYRRFARKPYPEDVAEVVTRAAEDENRHYQWAEASLKELGVGSGTLPHTVASAVEALHKALADPIEAVGRKVMEHVGSVVGTTRERPGGAAPSPAAAASNAAEHVADQVADQVVDRAQRAADAMGGPGAQAFVTALRAIETDGDVEPMIALYDDAAESAGPTDAAPHLGRDGARRFWKMYADSFQSIDSTFSSITETPDGTITLAWTSQGVAATGAPVAYAGVSIVEMRAGRITRFSTSYDPRDLDVGRAPGASTVSTASTSDTPTSDASPYRDQAYWDSEGR